MKNREAPARHHGYAPIKDYAAVGDGRTVALVARDGTIDWLCLPDLDSPSVFGALLDADRGGRFALAPEVPYTVERRYVRGTNVLETTFLTADGAVRVTDAMTLPAAGMVPMREVARRIEGLAGEVALRWSVEPRFGHGLAATRVGRRSGVPVATSGADAMAICSWEAGEPQAVGTTIGARAKVVQGSRALIALAAAHQEPLVLPRRHEVEARIDGTAEKWRRWLVDRRYDGPWGQVVHRSALALALLVHAPSGALAAAPTTSLPEQIGGERNWDYRFCWVRDSAFALDALLSLGCAPEADAFFWWLMQASQLTHPRLQVLYRLDGGARAPERTLPVTGYRGSRPVRVGNGALDQVQLDVYGDLLQTAWIYSQAGNRIDRDVGRRLAQTADVVCRIWKEPDSGIWEVRSDPRHFTHSKMLCWVALDRAARLAEAGQIPAKALDRWHPEGRAVRAFVEERCWSGSKRSYVRFAGGEELDASVLLGLLFGFHEPDHPRFRSTVDAVRRELGDGPFLYRYSGEDGLRGTEGAFLACSFWLVEGLVRSGRKEEAAELMERVLSVTNDVGLFSEEVDPVTGEFLGNFPQALTHLSLVTAATAFGEEKP
jgi:GH15 family glucan-1,4-alpha-glucosidase